MREQVGTVPVTDERIMRDPAFALGIVDFRAGLPFRKDYDRWGTNTQWNYERGRAWALLAPRHVRLKRRDGTLSADAVRWFRRASEIL